MHTPKDTLCSTSEGRSASQQCMLDPLPPPQCAAAGWRCCQRCPPLPRTASIVAGVIPSSGGEGPEFDSRGGGGIELLTATIPEGCHHSNSGVRARQSRKSTSLKIASAAARPKKYTIIRGRTRQVTAAVAPATATQAAAMTSATATRRARMLPRTLCRALITLFRFKVIAGQLSDDRVRVRVGVRR
jgi:hypothetical protein